jgi:hypothetical protein
LLDPTGPERERKAEILLHDGKQVLFRHVLNWESVSPITTSPAMVVIKSGERRYRILVRSRDQKLFRVTRIECKVPGIRGRAPNNSAALSQAVEIDGERTPRSESGRGVITVFTDHPAQGKVDVPFVVLD